MSKGGTLKFLSVCRVMALYLTLFGYFGNVYSGTVLVNSNNAIKNLPGGGAKPSDAVSPSPGTSLSEIIVQKAPVETLQVIQPSRILFILLSHKSACGILCAVMTQVF